MTLVVARITDPDDGRVSLLADTKITHSNGNVTANRHDLTRPGQKVVIVNDNLVVGFAGDNPDSGVRCAVNARDYQRTTQILDHLTQFSGEFPTVSRSFLVVERYPVPRLWRIVNGRCEERTEVRQAYVGDDDAYDRFRARTLEFDDTNSTDELRLVGSMQSVVAMEDLPTVGGYVVRVTGDRTTPFRFRGDPGMVGPWSTDVAVTRSKSGMTLRVTLSPGIDPTVHVRIDIAGRGDTFSALVHVVPQSGVAWLHTHEQPWGEPIKLDASSPQSIASGAARYGQKLELPTGLADEILSGRDKWI
ncbi:hypothetical protein [Rhodococcus sp. IEGM 1343]|uniref:hypothetical protein n=1 Tax=Rhodococcus sp. IEGM 1343 TaxID=3082224 RepID=UPI00295371A7|nr:hypothetical protein [Rhodococcus sp. IEGM 1343]MDV8058380.1 hypothetical protein [Rhodococcus sp. IEGM 1343]